MTQDTKNKFAAILAAQQAKVNNVMPTPQKIEQRQAKYMGSGIHVHQQFRPDQLVIGDTFQDADFGNMIWNGEEWIEDEMSNTTIADLLNDTQPVSLAPIFKLVDYSEKGFAILVPNYDQLSKEDAKLLIEKLHYTGGKYNKWLKCGKGWIFSKKKAYTVRKALNLI